jgi:hypothetical protein
VQQRPCCMQAHAQARVAWQQVNRLVPKACSGWLAGNLCTWTAVPAFLAGAALAMVPALLMTANQAQGTAEGPMEPQT